MSPEPCVRDAHFFFAPAGRGEQLYARTHLPLDPRETGIVIAAPIGRERIRVCHEMAVLGRDLAAEGFPVLRFDYRGEGESSREFRDSTVATRVEDAVAASDELRRRAGVPRIAIVGLHLGAAIGALAAVRAGAEALVMCDPVPDPKAYVTALLRTAVFQQSQYFGRQTAGEADLRAALRAGDTVTLYGAPAAAGLIDELECLDVEAALRGFRGRSLVLPFSSREGRPLPVFERWARLLGAPERSRVEAVVMNFSWRTQRRWMPRLGPLARLIGECVAGARAGTPGSLRLAATASERAPRMAEAGRPAAAGGEA